MNTPRVLVVDDERFNLEIISEFLADADYDLVLSDSGEEAWRRLDKGDAYDVVILDRMMPGLDGIELLRRIKADPRFAHMPVIMQTAAAAPDQVREGLEAGAYYYLTKPFEPEALLTIVRTALSTFADHRAQADQLACQARVMGLALRGEFQFRTPQQARDIAELVSNICPNPGIALLGLSELMINAVEHGNLGLGYALKTRVKTDGAWEVEIDRRLDLPENRHKLARLSFERELGEVRFTVTDCGEGFDWRAYLELDPLRAYDPNGRGIALARHLSFSRLEYNEKGNSVLASVALPPPASIHTLSRSAD